MSPTVIEGSVLIQGSRVAQSRADRLPESKGIRRCKKMFLTDFKYRILVAAFGGCLLGRVLLSFNTVPFALSAVYAATNFPCQVLITDDNGREIPGAAIQVSVPNARPVSTTTDAHGRATLNLPSGTMEFTVIKGGFITVQTTATVSGGTTPILLKIILTQSPLLKQEVTVRATPSNPTEESASAPATLAPEQAKLAPARPATLIDALPLVPGVVRTPDGKLQIGGSDETHSALLVNSVNVSDPGTGDFGMSIPIDTVRTISVSEMPYLAQYGKFTAGVIVAETRQGSDKWEYSLNDPLPDFRIRSGHLQGVRDMSPRLNLSGPLIRNKLYIMEGGEFLLDKREVRTLWWPHNETKSQAINSFTQVDWITSPKQTLTASFHIAPQSLRNVGLNFFNQQPVTPNADFQQFTASLLDRLQLGQGLLRSTFAVTRVGSEVYPQGSGSMTLSPGGNAGSYYNRETRLATRFQWIESWEPPPVRFHGAHQLQYGSVFSQSENEGYFDPRSVSLKDASGHLLQSINFKGPTSFDISDTEPAFYAQDHWTVNSRLGLDLGARVESQTISSTWRAAPRAGFVVTPFRSGNTVVRGGLGVFYDFTPLDVYAFPYYPEQVVTTYSPRTGAIVDGPRIYKNIIGRVPPNTFDLVHRAATSGNFAPYSVGGSIELQQSLADHLLIRLKYIQSAAQEMITITPQIVGDQSALELDASGQSHTCEIELTTRLGSDVNREFFFSYVRQFAHGEVSDATQHLGNFPYPIARSAIQGSLPGEVPNRFLLWGTYKIGSSWLVGPAVEFRNGFPFYPTNVFDQYQNHLPFQPRFPRHFSADARVSKDVDISKKHAVRFSISVVNLTNHFNPLEVHSNLADPQYGSFFGNYNRKFTLDFDFLH